MEYTPSIFFEGFGEAFLLPLKQQVTYFAMLWFGDYTMALPTLFAVLGVMLGHAANFGIGRFIMTMRNKDQIYLNDKVYKRGTLLLSTWLLPVLMFSWYNLGALIVLVAGFFNVPWKRALPAIAIGQILFFSYMNVMG